MQPDFFVSLPTDLDRQRPAAKISIEGLSVAYADYPKVLENITCEIPAGHIVSLVGPSGCGKSTLLRAIAGLLQPSSGTIEFTPTLSAQTGQLAYVFQSPTLLPWRNVDENIALPLEIGAANKRRVATVTSTRAAVESARRAVELDDDAGQKFPRELSGGMQMRASIARALVTDPSVLLLDEPFAALDDILRNKLNELLLQQWSERPRTIGFVTHNIAEAVYLSHRVLVMGNGNIACSIDNSLPWPRRAHLRSAPAFAEMYGTVSAALAEVRS